MILDLRGRFLILDTSRRFVREQRSSHSFYLLDWFWFSTSLLWDTLAFISLEFGRWVQYILCLLKQRASKANRLSVCALPIQLFVRRLAWPTQHRKQIWILKPGLFTFWLFQRARQVTKQQQSSNVALLFVKMASVMGVTWIFGIAANLQALSILWYP